MASLPPVRLRPGAGVSEAPRVGLVVPVVGEYKYSGLAAYPRPRWTPSKCKIVTCQAEDHALWTPFCERHALAKKSRIRRLAERAPVPEEPETGLANARRGTVVFGTYYLGTSADDDEGFAGDFYAKESDCALAVRRLNFIAERQAYVVREFVLR